MYEDSNVVAVSCGEPITIGYIYSKMGIIQMDQVSFASINKIEKCFQFPYLKQSRKTASKNRNKQDLLKNVRVLMAILKDVLFASQIILCRRSRCD